MTRVIIAGSRSFDNQDLFDTVLLDLLINVSVNEIEIVSGGCRGADKMGEEYAKKWYLPCTVFEADWNQYGKAAGPIRNEQMARYAKEADRGILIAFPVGESRGTRNMIEQARWHGLEVYVIEG